MNINGTEIDFSKQRGYFFHGDCLEGLKQMPNKSISLAICDPPYGGVTQGGYMTNQMGGGVARNRNDYHLSLWQCDKPDKTYFDELMRVSKNQIIWGGTITLQCCQIVSVG